MTKTNSMVYIVTCNVSPNICKCDKERDLKCIMSLCDMTVDKQDSIIQKLISIIFTNTRLFLTS